MDSITDVEELFKLLTGSDRIENCSLFFNRDPQRCAMNTPILTGCFQDKSGMPTLIGFAFNGKKWESFGYHG